MGVILEERVYGQIFFHTADTSHSYPAPVWIDRTAFVRSITAQRGVPEQVTGFTRAAVGSMTVELFSNTDSGYYPQGTGGIPIFGDYLTVGAYVKLSTADGVLWAGKVKELQREFIFDPELKVLTRLICVDWVAEAAQTVTTDNYYTITAGATLNAAVTDLDAYLGGASVLAAPTYTVSPDVSPTDDPLTVAQHLDDIANSVAGGRWYATNAVPTTMALPAAALAVRAGTSYSSTGLTFTDVAGAGLHYTDITVSYDTGNVVNNLAVTSNYLSGVDADGKHLYATHAAVATDAASAAAYGARADELSTRVYLTPSLFTGSSIPIVNSVSNPQLNNEVTGWTTLTANAQGVRTKPSVQVTPFDNEAGAGLYAFRTRVTTAVPSVTMGYAYKGEDLEVVAGYRYRFDLSAARGDLTSSLSQAQLQILWKDANQTVLSTSSSGNLSLGASARVWYRAGLLATAPAGAVFAELRWLFKRSDAANLAVGSHYWATAAAFYRVPLSGTPAADYFTGDTADTSTVVYGWVAEPHASNSAMYVNTLQPFADNIVDSLSTAVEVVRRLRWNAQEDISKLHLLQLDKTVTVVVDGVSATYLIIGLQLSVEFKRIMLEVSLKKV